MNNAIKNSVQLVGKLGADVKLVNLNNDRQVSEFSIAVDDSYKKDDQWVNQVQWFTVKAWGNTATVVADKLSKGDEVAINGKLVNRSYEDKTGITRYITEIELKEFYITNKRVDAAE